MVMVFRPLAPPIRQMGVDFWRMGHWWRSRPLEMPSHWAKLEDLAP